MGYLETLAKRGSRIPEKERPTARADASSANVASSPVGTKQLLVCDQVIFTSTRTPTGEGYRIIAASKSVRAEEKQAITRLSPSHDSLCASDGVESKSDGAFGPIRAAAMYPLPSSRLCLAASMWAGDEQTGRGGKRIYTLNLIFRPEDWSIFGFNPFWMIRALAHSEHVTPQLKPPQALPTIVLEPVPMNRQGNANESGVAPLTPNARREVLMNVLFQRDCVVPIDHDWIECGEALLLGAPGPLRAKISFSAGLRFSTTRRHKLEILALDSAAKARLSSSKVRCIDPQTSATANGNVWTDFVERHWSRGDLTGLARRTSRAFTSCAADSLNRIAGMYNQIDAMESLSVERVLATATEMLDPVKDAMEQEIRGEFTNRAQGLLQSRVQALRGDEFDTVWPRILGIARSASPRSAFAAPLIEPALRGLAARDCVSAARQTLEVCRIPNATNLLTPSFAGYIDERVTAWWGQADASEREAARGALRGASQGITHPLAARLAAIVSQ